MVVCPCCAVIFLLTITVPVPSGVNVILPFTPLAKLMLAVLGYEPVLISKAPVPLVVKIASVLDWPNTICPSLVVVPLPGSRAMVLAPVDVIVKPPVLF